MPFWSFFEIHNFTQKNTKFWNLKIQFFKFSTLQALLVLKNNLSGSGNLTIDTEGFEKSYNAYITQKKDIFWGKKIFFWLKLWLFQKLTENSIVDKIISFSPISMKFWYKSVSSLTHHKLKFQTIWSTGSRDITNFMRDR